MPQEPQFNENADILDDSDAINAIHDDLQTVFSGQNELDSSITVPSQLTIEESELNLNVAGTADNYLDEYKKSLLKSTDISERYHLDEISNVKKMISNVLAFMWVIGILSFLLIAICIILKLNVSTTITVPIFGTILEAISGCVVKVLHNSLRTREKFFEKEIEMQKYDKVLGLILTVSQDDRKNGLIEKVVDSYLKNQDNDNKEK